MKLTETDHKVLNIVCIKLLILHEEVKFIFDYMIIHPLNYKKYTVAPYGSKHFFSLILAEASKNSI